MGQTPHKTSHANSNWEPIGNSGRFSIFKNQNNQLAQKHVIPSNPKLSQSDELAAYYERYLPNRPLVNAYSAQFQSSKKGFCSNSQNLTAFIQYIPHRLSNIKKLSHGQGMYVLSQSLAGFSYLHKKFGAFPVNQDLIGFNKDGQVKVWNNPNFAQNHIDNDMVILMSTINPYDFDNKYSKQQQYDMVQDTFNAVSRHANFSPEFLKRGLHMQKLDFSSARSLVGQQIDRRAYYVPDHLNLPDKDGILQRSGIISKYRLGHENNDHNYHANNYKNNENYDQNDVQIQYVGNNQGNGTYNLNNQQGYGTYNLNGQNYRIISSNVVDDTSSQNESQLVRKALGGQAYYSSNGNYNENYNVHYINQNKRPHQTIQNANQKEVIYVNRQQNPTNSSNHYQVISPTNNHQVVYQNSNLINPNSNLGYHQEPRINFQTRPSRTSPYDPRGTYQTTNTLTHNPSQRNVVVQNSYSTPSFIAQGQNNLVTHGRNVENSQYITDQVRSPLRHKTIFDSHYRATVANNQLAYI